MLLDHNIIRILKSFLWGILFIVVINFLYYSICETFWLNRRSLGALCFSNLYQSAIFLLFKRFEINIVKCKLSSIFLIYLLITYITSGVGKFNWGEIPNYLLLKDTIFADISIYQNFTVQITIAIISIVLMILLIHFFNKSYKFQLNNEKKILNLSVFAMFILSISVYMYIWSKNDENWGWNTRDILKEDPAIGIWMVNNMYKLHVKRKQNFIVDYNIESLSLKDSTNIVILVIDALRPDHMSLNGYERITTPFLDSLSKISPNFYNTYLSTSSCTSSFCGILSILFGENFEKIPYNKYGIHNILKDFGYTTSFILGGSHRNFYGLSDFYGKNIDNYFESIEIKKINPTLSIYDDLSLVEYFNSDLCDIKRANYNFIYFHTMAPHEGALRDKTQFQNDPNYSELINEYDSGVLKADKIIRSIYNSLNQKGLLDNCLLIITSDHGEALLKNKKYNRKGHGGLPFDEVLNIPMIFIDSKTYSYKDQYATHIDILPTITHRLFNNFNLLASSYSGSSLLNTYKDTRLTYHVQKLKNNDLSAISIMKQQEGNVLLKYLFDPKNNEESIFDLRTSKNDNILVSDSSLLVYFRQKRIQYQDKFLK